MGTISQTRTLMKTLIILSLIGTKNHHLSSLDQALKNIESHQAMFDSRTYGAQANSHKEQKISSSSIDSSVTGISLFSLHLQSAGLTLGMVLLIIAAILVGMKIYQSWTKKAQRAAQIPMNLMNQIPMNLMNQASPRHPDSPRHSDDHQQQQGSFGRIY